jgi:hypothetical protein
MGESESETLKAPFLGIKELAADNGRVVVAVDLADGITAKIFVPATSTEVEAPP